MATQDISRFLLQPSKHYSTVHMQQGRVIVDSDWNERANIEAEDLRASLLDIICSKGTPNDGMKITGATKIDNIDLPLGATTNTITFNVGAGSYYIGGLRFAIESGTTFLNQTDWLQVNAHDDNLPSKPDAARFDLVYAYAWEQPVTAVEDSELREVALGDRDTSTRIKRMCRFMVKENVGTADGSEAFEELIAQLATEPATYDAETCELRSGALMEVTLVESDKEEDLCADPAVSGYVAAENQAIRVELRPDNKWVWGFDNASKLYRVKIGNIDEVNERTTLHFLTEPADLPSMPRAGQVVEVVAWGAKLPNQEKVAELQGGVTTVYSSYDPSDKTMVIVGALPAAAGGWLELHEEHHNSADTEPEYLYLRVWDRGAEIIDNVTTLAEYPISDIPRDLGSTGLAVRFPATGIPGDYWIIAARPSTPELVTPWDLTTDTGVPPHGPRRFYAPLATLSWSAAPEAEISDCRTQLRRLCEGGCCTLTVGDGERSFGHVNSLDDAVELVPNGGKICVLPGLHKTNAVLDERVDIVIEGCGPNSVLIAHEPLSDDEATSEPELFYAPVLTIKNSERIRVQNLRIQAHSAVGVAVERTEGKTCSHVTLEDLQIFSTGAVNGAADVFEFVAPSVTALGVTDVDIRNCDLEQDVWPSITEIVVLGGSRLRLVDSRVIAPIYDGVSTLARGGVNIRSGSYDVEVIGCLIEGGWGHGISLGHVDEFERDAESEPTLLVVLSKLVGKGLKWILPNGNFKCIEPGPGGKKKASSDGTDMVVLPLGPVEQVRIHDNVIRRMGMSGISTAEFFDSKFDWRAVDDFGPVFIVAAEIDICRNTIEDNVLRTSLPETLANNFDDCVGGICLAASINPVIRENRIMRNGTGNYRLPVCGIGLIAAQNVVIQDNQIIGNGAEFPEDGELVSPGMRGGIVVVEVTPVRGFTFPQAAQPELPAPVTDYEGASGGSALVVRGNEVVSPLGRGLWVLRSHGAVTVTGNTLESLGNPAPLSPLFTLRYSNGTQNVTRPMGGACVEIFGYSKALDVEWEPEEVAVIPRPSWVDSGVDTLEDGGNTLVSGNVIRLNWNVIGGISTAVLISTLASAVFDNNDVFVGMSSEYEAGVGVVMNDFYNAILANSQEYSFVISSVYIAGYSTGQANGNRVTEGKFDALFSLTVGTVLRTGGEQIEDVVHGVCSTANTLTHANPLIDGDTLPGRTIIPDPAPLLAPPLVLNAVIYTDESAPDAYVVLGNTGAIGGIGRAVVIADYDAP